MDIIYRNVTEFTQIDPSKISKADLQLFAEQMHTLKLVDARHGVPLGRLTRKLVLKRINDILADDTGLPDPPDEGECSDSNQWSTVDW